MRDERTLEYVGMKVFPKIPRERLLRKRFTFHKDPLSLTITLQITGRIWDIAAIQHFSWNMRHELKSSPKNEIILLSTSSFGSLVRKGNESVTRLLRKL